MRVLLIDPWQQTLEVAAKEPGLDGTRKLLSGPTLPIPGIVGAEGHDHVCRLVDYVSLGVNPATGQPIDVWVDDESLLEWPQAYCVLNGYTLGGRAMIASSTAAGETCATDLDVTEVWPRIRFIEHGMRHVPQEPTLVGFDSLDMLKFLLPEQPKW